MLTTLGADDDDDAVLRAALAFIGDFDFNNDGAATANVGGEFSHPQDASPAAPFATVGVAPTPPKPPGRPHSSSRRRDELQYLRGQVQELELQLRALRSRVDDQVKTKPEKLEMRRLSPLVVEAWERVVQRQYEQRRHAEFENTQLKMLLEDQIQVGKALERVLSKKRPRDIEALRLEMERPRNVVPAFGDTSRLFHDLFASIDKQYLETDRIQAKVKHERSSVSRHDVRLVHDLDAGLVLQTTECRVFPFAYQDTAQAVWDSIMDTAGYGSHHIDKTDAQQTLKLHIENSTGSFHTATDVFLASRRYTEADRTVIVSAAVVDPSQIAHMNMDGIHMRYRAWSIIEPLQPSIRDRSTKVATRMMAYTTASPVVNGNAVQEPTRKAGALTDFVMSGLAFDKESRQSALENRLFALSIGGAR